MKNIIKAAENEIKNNIRNVNGWSVHIDNVIFYGIKRER